MRKVSKYVKTRRGTIVLAAVAAALLVEAGVVLAGAAPLGHHRAVAVRLPENQVIKRGSTKVVVGQAVAHYRIPSLRDAKPAPEIVVRDANDVRERGNVERVGDRT